MPPWGQPLLEIIVRFTPLSSTVVDLDFIIVLIQLFTVEEGQYFSKARDSSQWLTKKISVWMVYLLMWKINKKAAAGEIIRFWALFKLLSTFPAIYYFGYLLHNWNIGGDGVKLLGGGRGYIPHRPPGLAPLEWIVWYRTLIGWFVWCVTWYMYCALIDLFHESR